MSLARTLTMALAMAGGLTASQAPEFAQQYRQRIGGALAELGRVVEDFDRDAAKNGMNRLEALALHAQSEEPLFRDRGESMRRAIERMERLLAQRLRFEETRPVAQPLTLMAADPEIVGGVWRDFNPAVPVTPQGFAWAGAGAAAAALLFWVLAELSRRTWRAFRRPRLPLSAHPAPAPPVAHG